MHCALTALCLCAARSAFWLSLSPGALLKATLLKVQVDEHPDQVSHKIIIALLPLLGFVVSFTPMALKLYRLYTGIMIILKQNRMLNLFRMGCNFWLDRSGHSQRSRTENNLRTRRSIGTRLAHLILHRHLSRFLKLK